MWNNSCYMHNSTRVTDGNFMTVCLYYSFYFQMMITLLYLLSSSHRMENIFWQLHLTSKWHSSICCLLSYIPLSEKSSIVMMDTESVFDKMKNYIFRAKIISFINPGEICSLHFNLWVFPKYWVGRNVFRISAIEYLKSVFHLF